MSREDTIDPAESAPKTRSTLCASCGEATSHMFDEELGYYKKCSRCGHIEYLNRRFLRLDKNSRQWR